MPQSYDTTGQLPRSHRGKMPDFPTTTITVVPTTTKKFGTPTACANAARPAPPKRPPAKPQPKTSTKLTHPRSRTFSCRGGSILSARYWVKIICSLTTTITVVPTKTKKFGTARPARLPQGPAHAPAGDDQPERPYPAVARPLAAGARFVALVPTKPARS
jgi:hypothetical protein